MKKQALHKSDIIAALLENAVTIILTAFVIFMIFYRPSFSSWANITAIINDCCMYGITALGMTTVILCGEIDLSVSSIYAWSTCLFVILCNAMNVFLAALITLATAVVWGVLNGALIAYLRMPAFVATLGSMYTIKGLAYYITEQKPINTTNEMLAAIGKALAPIFAPLGFGNWVSSTALITGLTAKEAVVSTLAVLVNVSDVSLLPAVLTEMFTPLSAVSFLAFTLLYMPCMAAVAAVKRELGGLKYAVAAMAAQCGVAWVVACLIYQVGRLIIGG